MRKLIGMALIIFATCLLQLNLIAEEDSVVFVPEKSISEVKLTNYSYKQQVIGFEEGYFFNRRIDYVTSDGYYITRFIIPGDTGTISYFDDNKVYHNVPLTSGQLPTTSILYIETDQYNYALGQGYTYQDIGNGTKISIEDERYPITLTKNSKGWMVTYKFKQIEDCHSIMWGVGSSAQLVDFSEDSYVTIMSVYDVDNNARFCEDGYYYKSPESYVPTDQNAFWRNPSMYVVTAFTKTGGSLFADMMSQAWLIVASENLNDEGYFPTLPQSNWLKDTYGFEAGFFDTRFNSDIIETYLHAYKKFGNPLFREVYLEAANFYLSFAQDYHFVNETEAYGQGWLVEDYYHRLNMDRKTHTSLNHQLQAINMFLLLYEEEGDERYLTTSQYMLAGIKNTLDLWIMEDSNLEYAYLPDGTMGFVDYPYLTYNDLFKAQVNLERINGHRDEQLELLMSAKKIWMDANGVTNYMN